MKGLILLVEKCYHHVRLLFPLIDIPNIHAFKCMLALPSYFLEILVKPHNK